MSLFLGQSYRKMRINMHIWRGVEILVIFATIGEKREFLPSPSLSLRAGCRNAYKEDAHSSRDRHTEDAAKKFSITCVNCVSSLY